MKTLRFFLVMAAMLFAASNADAQNTMRVHHKDGTVHVFNITDVSFVDWSDENASDGKTTKPEFEDIEIKSKTYHLGISGAVDLGLSVKWAAYNIGAEAPGDYGDYYAWGETETKSDYSLSTYFDSNYYKYATNKNTKLDLNDDVTHVKWGGSWRMPTKAEQDDLRTKCTWVWTTYGGHNGYVVVGSTGNAIFLPAAGNRYGTGLDDASRSGRYWSSSLYEGGSYYAYYLDFNSDFVDWRNGNRYYGLSVRTVCP